MNACVKGDVLACSTVKPEQQQSVRIDEQNYVVMIGVLFPYSYHRTGIYSYLSYFVTL